MKVTCEKNIFKTAIDQVSKAISSKTPMQILTNVLIQAENSTLTLMATDLALGISCSIEAESFEDGSVVCPANLLTAIVSNMPNGTISLDTDREFSLKISNDTSVFEIPTLNSEEFPTFPKIDKKTSMFISAGDFCSMVNKVAFAASDSQERPIMMGVLLKFEPESLTMVATDAKRLSKLTMPLPRNDERDQSIIVSANSLKEITKILDKKNDIELNICPTQLFIETPGTRIYTRLLDGNFPDFQRVIPQSFIRTCQMSKDSLQSALKRVIITAQDKDSPNMVRFDFSSDKLIMSSSTANVGAAIEEIPAMLTGEPIVISFNAKFILDALQVLESDEIQLDLQEEHNGAVLRPFEDTNFAYVCMPIRPRS